MPPPPPARRKGQAKVPSPVLLFPSRSACHCIGRPCRALVPARCGAMATFNAFSLLGVSDEPVADVAAPKKKGKKKKKGAGAEGEQQAAGAVVPAPLAQPVAPPEDLGEFQPAGRRHTVKERSQQPAKPEANGGLAPQSAKEACAALERAASATADARAALVIEWLDRVRSGAGDRVWAHRAPPALRSMQRQPPAAWPLQVQADGSTAGRSFSQVCRSADCPPALPTGNSLRAPAAAGPRTASAPLPAPAHL